MSLYQRICDFWTGDTPQGRSLREDRYDQAMSVAVLRDDQRRLEAWFSNKYHMPLHEYLVGLQEPQLRSITELADVVAEYVRDASAR